MVAGSGGGGMSVPLRSGTALAGTGITSSGASEVGWTNSICWASGTSSGSSSVSGTSNLVTNSGASSGFSSYTSSASSDSDTSGTSAANAKLGFCLVTTWSSLPYCLTSMVTSSIVNAALDQSTMSSSSSSSKSSSNWSNKSVAASSSIVESC